MLPTVARNHHFVPQFLLRNFVDGNGKLWVYDTESQTIEARGTKRSAATEDLYGWSKADGSTDFQTIEDYFSKVVENGAALAIRKLLRRELLAPAEISYFFRFVAAQLCRTPAFFSRIHDSMAPMMQEMFERMAKFDPGFRQRLSVSLAASGTTTEEIDRLFTLMGNGSIKAKPAREFVIQQSLRLIENLAEEFSRMHWCFLAVPAGEPDLVIGDHPVTLHDAHPASDGQRPLGVCSPHVEIILPLSRGMIACARWDGPISYGQLETGAAEVANNRTLRAAQRYIFAPHRSDALLQRAIAEKAHAPQVRVQRIVDGERLAIATAYY